MADVLNVPLVTERLWATKRYVSATLDACEGNKAEAARRLEIGRNTIGRMFNRDSDPGDGDE